MIVTMIMVVMIMVLFKRFRVRLNRFHHVINQPDNDLYVGGVMMPVWLVDDVITEERRTSRRTGRAHKAFFAYPKA
jgi:hypothetical protein